MAIITVKQWVRMALLLPACWGIADLSFHPGAGAQHAGHQMAAPEGDKKKESPLERETSPTRVFLLEGGIKASFSILPMAEYQNMLRDMKMKAEVDPQATHNLAVTLTDTRSNRPINDAVVKMKVIGPTGKEQIRLLDSIPAMNQYAQDFTLAEEGRYQVLILFQRGGQKRAAGFYHFKK